MSARSSPVRRDALVAGLCLAAGGGIASAQSLPEAFDPSEPNLEQAAGTVTLLAQPGTVVQQWSVGASTVSLGPGTRASFAPFGWMRRETLASDRVWLLQVQTDGYKRVSSPAGDRRGLADLTLSSVWDSALGERFRGRATLGAVVPSHGEVGSKKWAMLLGGGLLGTLTSTTQAGGTLLVVQNVPPAISGGSRTLWRADANVTVAWSPTLRSALSGVSTYQESAPQLRELALLTTLVLKPGMELRARAWEQRIDATPRRRGLGITIVLAN